MKLDLASGFLPGEAGEQAADIIRKCVHCGMCNAACPTYRLTGNELDGPRGRIYLVKSMLEDGEAGREVTRHLDRCLTCRACETVCPSGVEYGELVEIARPRLKRRPLYQRMFRGILMTLASRPRWFRLAFRVGAALRALVPKRFRGLFTVASPQPQAPSASSTKGVKGRIILLDGCVQSAVTPQVNVGLTNLLEGAGFLVIQIKQETCCGALPLHLGAARRAKRVMHRNLKALAANLAGVEAIVSTASGCGVTLKDYGRLLGTEDARRVASLVVDASEFLASPAFGFRLRAAMPLRKIAWQAPCTLASGMRLAGQVEALLKSVGYTLVPVADANQCCGSAGTYSIFEPDMANALREKKLQSLQAGEPDAIATANIGCQMHLGQASSVPVYHWLELVQLQND